MQDRRTLSALVLLFVVALAAPGWATTGATSKRVSVSSAGTEGNGGSGTRTGEAMSADGRFVAFDSFASNLVGSDSNGFEDVFVRGLSSHKTTLVSQSSSGVQGDNISFSPSISADGHVVAFQSLATNLIAGGTTGDQVFVRDLTSHKTTLVSVSSTGVQGNSDSLSPSISADGRFVAFASVATNLVAGGTTGEQVFIRDVVKQKTTLVSMNSLGVAGNAGSYRPSISGDGNSVAFSSSATDLVGNDTNGFDDVFVRNRTAHKTRRVSVSSAGAEANSGTYNSSISAGGRYVAMTSAASNLVANDSNGHADVFVRDRKTNRTKLVSLSSSGAQGNNGSFLVDPAITPDGRFVAFGSVATNLIGGGSTGEQVFVRDLASHRTTLISVSSSGVQGNNSSFDASITSDGRFVAFNSNATNLVPNDTAGYRDVFIRGPLH